MADNKEQKKKNAEYAARHPNSEIEEKHVPLKTYTSGGYVYSKEDGGQAEVTVAEARQALKGRARLQINPNIEVRGVDGKEHRVSIKQLEEVVNTANADTVSLADAKIEAALPKSGPPPVAPDLASGQTQASAPEAGQNPPPAETRKGRRSASVGNSTRKPTSRIAGTAGKKKGNPASAAHDPTVEDLVANMEFEGRRAVIAVLSGAGPLALKTVKDLEAELARDRQAVAESRGIEYPWSGVRDATPAHATSSPSSAKNDPWKKDDDISPPWGDAHSAPQEPAPGSPNDPWSRKGPSVSQPPKGPA